MERAGWGREEVEGGGDKHLWFVCVFFFFAFFSLLLKCSDCKGRRAKEDDASEFVAQLIVLGWEIEHLYSPQTGNQRHSQTGKGDLERSCFFSQSIPTAPG